MMKLAQRYILILFLDKTRKWTRKEEQEQEEAEGEKNQKGFFQSIWDTSGNSVGELQFMPLHLLNLWMFDDVDNAKQVAAEQIIRTIQRALQRSMMHTLQLFRKTSHGVPREW